MACAIIFLLCKVYYKMIVLFIHNHDCMLFGIVCSYMNVHCMHNIHGYFPSQ